MTYTKVPNWYIEKLPTLSSAATLVFLVICRSTIGWQKSHDVISLSQFEQRTGLSRPTVIKSLQELQRLDIISRTTNGWTISSKETLPLDDEGSKETLLVEIVYSKETLLPKTQPSKESLPAQVKFLDQPLVKEFDTLKKHSIERKKEVASPRDARLDSFALTAYRELARLHIPHALRDTVIATVEDEQLWRQVITAWIGRGYRPNAITGMLDWYKKGIPNDSRQRPRNGRQNSTHPASTLSAEDYVKQQETNEVL